jgi:hypothetical protein
VFESVDTNLKARPDSVPFGATNEGGPMSEEPKPEPEQDSLRAVYSEISASYHAIDDFRARLLSFLPVASGAGGLLILLQKDGAKESLGPISVFGLCVTLGLFFYELIGSRRCKDLIKLGADFEHEMHVENGPFKSKLHDYFINVRKAGWFVYTTVLVGWIYIAYLAFYPLIVENVNGKN